MSGEIAGDWPIDALHRLDAYLDEHPEARASLIAEEARRRKRAERESAPLPDSADVRALTGLLDLLANFPSNEQRARFLLSCDWMRERDAAMQSRLRQEMAR